MTPIELPQCRWRGASTGPGHRACSSPKLIVPPQGVTVDDCLRCYCPDHPPTMIKRGPAPVLHQMNHGLGDCVQAACVIRHLRHHRPGQEHHVVCQPGKGSPFTDCAIVHLSDRRDHIPPGRWSSIVRHPWHNPDRSYPDCPSTKVTHYLRETEHLPIVPDLLRYRVTIPERVQELAAAWVAAHVGARRFAIIHHEGSSWRRHKDLPIDVVQVLVTRLQDLGVVPVVLDWSSRSPLLLRPGVICPARGDPLWGASSLGTAEGIAALMRQSSLNVMIDSGPGKVAAAVASTPCITCWTELHPVHFSDLDWGQVLHLIPQQHDQYIRGDKRLSLPYFARHYLHRVYHDLAAEVIRHASAALEVIPGHFQCWPLVARMGCILPGNPLATWSDRDVSVSLLLGLLRQRQCPVVVETGCVREEDDWTAGNSTVVFGHALAEMGGRLVSVDRDRSHVALARRLTAGLPVTVEHGDSVGWLRGYGGPLIHALYLDSLDVGAPGCEEHCLQEVQAGIPHLTRGAPVLIDDTVQCDGHWVGKGALAVPHLLSRGARLVHSGYQQLLVLDQAVHG